MMEDFAQYGIAGIAMACVLVAIKVIEKISEKRKGDTDSPTVDIDMHEMSLILRNLDSSVKKMSEHITATRNGTERLVAQHAPVDGVEQWKVTPRLERLMDQLTEHQGEVLRLLQRMVISLDRLAESNQE